MTGNAVGAEFDALNNYFRPDDIDHTIVFSQWVNKVEMSLVGTIFQPSVWDCGSHAIDTTVANRDWLFQYSAYNEERILGFSTIFETLYL